MSFRPRPTLWLGLCAAWLAGTAGVASRPLWIEQHKSDDSVYLYRVGHAAGLSDEGAARQAAYADAIAVILDEMMTRAGIEPDYRAGLKDRLGVRNAEIMPDCAHTEMDDTGYSAWVQVSYPLTEKDHLLAQLSEEKDRIAAQVRFSAELGARWERARQLAAQGDLPAAGRELQQVLHDYPQAIHPPFDQDEAQLLLGDVYRDQHDVLSARQWYETVAAHSTAPARREAAAERVARLPPPPRYWPMKGRLGSATLGLWCARREGTQGIAAFPELLTALSADFRAAHVECADLFPAAAPDNMPLCLQGGDCAPAIKAASAQGHGAALLVLVNLDPAKRGQTEELLGVAMPVPDAEISLALIDVAQQRIAYQGQFKEITGGQSAAKLGARVANISVLKYLIPNCPALSAPP